MIDKGESALNIDLVRKSEIVPDHRRQFERRTGALRACRGPCRIRETQPSITRVDTDLLRTASKAMNMIKLKFDDSIRAFAALDGPRS